MNPIQAAEDALESLRNATMAADGRRATIHPTRLKQAVAGVEALLTHARTLEAELERLRDPLGDGAELVRELEISAFIDGCLFGRAAAFIERQAAALAHKTAVADAYWAMIEAFKAENAELRAALREAERSMSCGRDDSAHYCPNCDNSSFNARAKIRTILAKQDAGHDR